MSECLFQRLEESMSKEGIVEMPFEALTCVVQGFWTLLSYTIGFLQVGHCGKKYSYSLL